MIDVEALSDGMAHDGPACREAADEIRRLRADAARLDWLDQINKNANARNGTVYGWRFDINHNRAALMNHNFPALTIRQAIDAAINIKDQSMTAAEHQVVWENAAARLHKTAMAAKAEGAGGAETALLQFAAFAMTVAAAYQDSATVFKAS